MAICTLLIIGMKYIHADISLAARFYRWGFLAALAAIAAMLIRIDILCLMENF